MYKIYKLFLTTLVYLFLCNNFVTAQKRASIGLSYDVGLSTYFFVSDMNINYDIIQNNFIQSHGGGVVFNYLDKIMGIQVGAKLVPKGWVENFMNGASNQFIINYLEIPIMTHMRFGRKKKSGLILNYGLFLAKALNYKIKENEEPNYQYDTLFIDYHKPEFSKYEYGIKGGIGYEFEIGRSSLQLQVMFAQGMNDLFKPDRIKLYKSLSQTISAGIIYKFSFYRKAAEDEQQEIAKMEVIEKKEIEKEENVEEVKEKNVEENKKKNKTDRKNKKKRKVKNKNTENIKKDNKKSRKKKIRKKDKKQQKADD